MYVSLTDFIVILLYFDLKLIVSTKCVELHLSENAHFVMSVLILRWRPGNITMQYHEKS